MIPEDVREKTHVEEERDELEVRNRMGGGWGRGR